MRSNDQKCFSGLRSFDLPRLIFFLPVDHHFFTQAIITVVLASVAFDHSIFLDLSFIFLLIIVVVLKPSSLLYLPSMTSLHCLITCQQSSALSLLNLSGLLCSIFLKYFWCPSVTFFPYSCHLHCCTCHQ